MNHKKLLRLYREEGLAVRRRRGRKRATGTRAPMACGRSVAVLYNQVRPHSAQGGLTPEAAHRRSAGDRLRNPDQLRRAPATNEPAEAL